MTGRRPHRVPSAGATRDRILLFTLVPLGLFLFALGFIGASTGLTVVPFDPHHIGTQVAGLVLAAVGLTHWK
ncbi:hypothetical protein [Streptomyces sp. NBC_01236]|uniref:hypothetical protein n=1 Tax=Streptomyces sp. NBC_01236 TaxID=2903789 RepID=UPI002E122D96|nr:hypothetical protein OG324_40500 [Streptomyces sp. NBC_01236]